MSLLSLRRPTPDRLFDIANGEAEAPFTYPDVGHTAHERWSPTGWSPDEAEIALGTGNEVFEAAVGALRRWTQFDLSWVWPLTTEVPVEPGATFAFLSRSLGVWSVNVCRVVYVIDDEDEAGRRFGFAYGTVGAHAVRGEEQFLLTMDPVTLVVRFRIRKFSLPAHPLLRVAGPVTRRVQRRFTEDALRRMRDEVAA